MKKQELERGSAGKYLIPIVMVHLVCCGAIIFLPVIVGSIGFAGLLGWLSDPLAQFAAAIFTVVALVILWRRFPKVRTAIPFNRSIQASPQVKEGGKS